MDTHRRKVWHRQWPGGEGCSSDMRNGHTPKVPTGLVPGTTVRWRYVLLIAALSVQRPAGAVECPAVHGHCMCEWQGGKGLIVNCRFASLTEVPTWTNSTLDIYELTLAHNNIQNLNAYAFSAFKFKRLDLSANQITTIDLHAFAGQEESLEKLTLHVDGMEQFPSEALARLVSLQELYIDGFNIPSIGLKDIETLDKLHTLKLERCGLNQISYTDISSSIKDTLVVLSLRNNQLINIDQRIISQLKNLETLDLAHNKFAVMADNLFSGNAKISKLDFSNNELQTIRTDAYRGLEDSLVNLILQHNKLTDNQLKPLKVLRILRDLNLAYNQIGAIHVDTFLSTERIENINLRANKLTALQKPPFVPVLDYLKELELADNNIISIEQGFFNGFKVLEILDLSGQKLHQVINKETFAGLEGSLRRLTMSSAELTSSDLEIVSNLTSLHYLAMGKNNITQIPEWNFVKLSQLETLDLSSNAITALPPLSMDGMQASLSLIDMNSNELETIPECTFKEFKALKQIRLSMNPLKCDCNVVWLHRWKKANNPTVYIWKCASPSFLKDIKLHSVTESQLCPEGYTPMKCKKITTTTPSASTLAVSMLTPSHPLVERVNVTSIIHDAALIQWNRMGSTTTNYSIEVRGRSNFKIVLTETLPVSAKQYWLTDLKPNTNYTVCVTPLNNGSEPVSRICEDFLTNSAPGAVTGNSNTGAIIGAILGVLIVLALLALFGFLFARSRNSGKPFFTIPKWLGGKKGPKKRTITGIPRITNTSRRFSRPRQGCTASTTSNELQQQQNNANSDLEMKLAGFSAEERDRIINMLTTTGGSTVSMISSGSAQRYVPELPPRPPELEGYLNPKTISDQEDDPEMHVYDEIPGASANYYEEPIRRNHLHNHANPQRKKSTESVHSGKYENPAFHSSQQDGACYM